MSAETMIRPRAGLTASAVLLLCGALLGLMVITLFADYSFPQDPAEIGALLEDRSNNAFFTFIVLYAIQFAVLGGGIGAVGVAAGDPHRASGALGVAAGVISGTGAAVLTISPVVLSGMVNRWSPDLLETESGIWDVLDAFRFGADQAGYAILAIGLAVLAIALFLSRSIPRWTGVPTFFVAVMLLSGVTGGEDVLPMVPFLATLVLGATFLVARLASKPPIESGSTTPSGG